GVGPLAVVTAFAVFLALSWTFPLRVLRQEETVAYHLDEAFLVAMALLVPPLGIVLAFGTAVLVSHLALRRPMIRAVFNTAVMLTSTGLALGAVRLVGGQSGAQPLDLAAVVIGAAVFLVVNSIFVASVISVIEEQSFWPAWRDGIRFWLHLWAATVAVGLLGGLAGLTYSWALLLAALPMAVLQIVLSGALRARRDRERLDGLLHAAMDAQSVDPSEVEEAITGSARAMLHCRDARLSDVPPGPSELGSRVQGRGHPERWLVVGEPRGVEQFKPQDAKLLDAIVAVGSGALENARLVDQMKHQVFHDALTGLPNQLLFEERVTYALAQQRGSGHKIAVLFIDLDRFKRVNDSLGHPAGNELLRQVSRRLAAVVRRSDTVARMGGDEFTLLLADIRTAGEAELVAEKILAAFRYPFVLHGQELFVTPSIGVAIGPDDGNRPSLLLKNADTAMYRAKDRGRNCYETYAVHMNATAEGQLALEGDLHHAIDTGQLRVVYQPQIDLTSGRMVGVEALVRWPHPTLGMITPDRFVPMAEETGLIVPLDDWMLGTACRQARAWSDAGLPPLRVAVNISGRAFQRANVVERVEETLIVTGLEPERLELEVTESMAIDQVSDTRPVFCDLETLGVKLAIDDFGTGYSALSRLRGFPFHTLKIDRSFISEIEDPSEEAPIVAAMIAMAHAMKLDVVAEGVETQAQRLYLDRHHCDIGQGYLFSRPVEASVVEEMLAPVAA
ncbi:MAG: EAL domain-containing protein, partial [Actinomycetota bacterium]|nr:EAL domain-containing protein [Actinomycetota bacterium]